MGQIDLDMTINYLYNYMGITIAIANVNYDLTNTERRQSWHLK
jgi:hypothetical protein